jgi:hypothetical protein
MDGRDMTCWAVAPTGPRTASAFRGAAETDQPRLGEWWRQIVELIKRCNARVLEREENATGAPYLSVGAAKNLPSDDGSESDWLRK